MKKPTLILFALLGIMLIANAQNNALHFNGDNDYVNITNLGMQGWEVITIEAWVYAYSFNPLNPDNYISNIAGTDDASSLLRIGDNHDGELISDNTPQFVIETTSGTARCSATTQMITNTWYHIAGTYDGTNLKIYVNGILEKTVSHTGNIVSNASNVINLGGATGDRYLDGQMDEVRIWNVAHSESEINSSMCFELTGSESNLVAYYKLNETTGTTAYDFQTGGTYNGTLSGTTFDISSVTSTALITGDGTTNTPYQIAQKNHINWIKSNSASWDKSFLQIANIDASGTSSWNSGIGLFLIGNSTTKFTGTYDGGGYTISNLSHTAANLGNNAGLFGYNYGATIKNLGLISITITASSNTGAIAGCVDHSTIISNCYSSGAIIGNQVVGGIVGLTRVSSLISGCYSSGTVSGYSDLGGIVGFNDEGTILINCYSRANISANAPSIGNAGGLVGFLISSTILNSYSTGTVSVNGGYIGGLVGRISGTVVVTNSFWDTETSGQATSYGGTGKTTTEMKTQSTFTNAGWDFTSPIWAIAGGTNDGYPNLLSNTIPTSWIGKSSTAWNTTTNWDGLAIPTASDNVSIIKASNNPVINNTGAVCNNLVIATSASLSINETKDLTVNGNLTNNGTLTLESSASGTGSLIVEGTATGDVIMERYIEATNDWNDWEDGWHFLSSPVADYAIASNFTTDPASNYDFYAWSELYNVWVNYKDGTNPAFSDADVNGSNTFELGYGYMAAYAATDIKNFTGTINVGDVEITGLTITGSSNDYRSWHLLGNPFNSGLIWHTGWATSNITGTAQIWNESGKSYTAITSGGTIPATNGFMVQATLDGASLTIPETKRTHGGTFYKSAEFPVIKLKAINLDRPSFQESQLLFNPESTNNWDMEFDCDFLAGYAPLFYSKIEGMPMAVNSMPVVTGSTTIPFTFIKNEGLNFSIEMYESENMDMDVWLLDKKLNKDHNLTQNPIYVFTAFEQDYNERFVIHFSPLGIEEPESTELIQIWASNNSINILNPNNFIGEIRLINMYGQEVFKSKLNGDSNQQISVNVASGYYIVNTVTKTGVVNTKIYLR